MPFCLPAGVHTPTVVVHVVCYDVPLGEVGWDAQHMLLQHPFAALDALSLAVCNAHLQQPVPTCQARLALLCHRDEGGWLKVEKLTWL